MNADWSEQEVRRDLVMFSGWLSRLGFTPATAGNLSVRLDRNRILATPTGMSKCDVEESDLVVVDSSGQLISGTRKVTSEIGMHLAIYEGRQDVAAVMHSHPPIATAFACSGRGLDQMFYPEAVLTIGRVPLARYATTGTEEVAASLSPFLADHDVILLANHGAVSYGRSLKEAFLKMEIVEHVAQIALVAHQLGSPRPLDEAKMRNLHAKKGCRDNGKTRTCFAVDPDSQSTASGVSADFRAGTADVVDGPD